MDSGALTKTGFLAAVALAWLGFASVAVADNDPDTLKLDALAQEGDLILEEAAALEPETAQLTQEGEQLDAAENTVRAESDALNTSILEFNARMAAWEKAVQNHKMRCPRQSENAALVEACNTGAREIDAAADQRLQEREQLQVRQKTLNERIAHYNAARREWTKRKQDLDARVAPNRGDLKDWLNRAEKFFASEPFKVFAQQAKNPEVCGPERIGDLANLSPVTALRQAQECLNALKASVPRAWLDSASSRACVSVC